MLLKVARIPPMACKIIGSRQSRINDLSFTNRPVRTKRSRQQRKNLPSGRKLPMKRTRLYPIVFSDQIQYGGAVFHASSCAIVPYRSVLPIAAESDTRYSIVVAIFAVRRNRDSNNRALKVALRGIHFPCTIPVR